jgi:hypothetical protein
MVSLLQIQQRLKLRLQNKNAWFCGQTSKLCDTQVDSLSLVQEIMANLVDMQLRQLESKHQLAAYCGNPWNSEPLKDDMANQSFAASNGLRSPWVLRNGKN